MKKTITEENISKLPRADLEAEYLRLQKENDEVVDAFMKVIQSLNNSKSVVRRLNLQRFFSPRDNAAMDEARKEEEKAKKESKEEKADAEGNAKLGRPVGSKTHQDYLESLAKLAEENEPLSEDALARLPEEERTAYVKIGEDVGYLLTKTTEKITVRKVIRPAYKNRETGKIIKEPSHAPLLGCFAGPSVLSDLLLMKYGLGVPHYRYCGYLRVSGIPVDTQTLYRWSEGACRVLKPVCGSLQSLLRRADVVHIDETPVRELDAEGRVHAYVFVFSAEVDGHRIRLYRFNEDRKTDIVDEVLGKDYRGLIVVDGYDGYDRFERLGLSVQRCLVHARRKWTDILSGLPKKARKGSFPEKAVKCFDSVFRDEEVIRQIGPKTPEERLKLRKSPENAAHIEELRKMMREAKEKYAKGTPEQKAADYFLGDEDCFLTFTKDGRVPADNQEAERTVKPYALSRRNFLFVRGNDGGEASCTATTLIQNALVNGLDPERYLEWLLSEVWKQNLSEGHLPFPEQVPAECLAVYEAHPKKKGTTR